jgi:hypothetical protein
MALDFPASGTALWAIFDQTGIRPEYLLVCLYAESGFNPAIANQAGAPYYGLNQVSATFLQSKGIDPTTYLTYSASQQLSQVVAPYMENEVSVYGPLTSGIRVEQANFYPASLSTATTLNSVIVSSPAAAYTANKSLDTTNKGNITVRDLATFLSKGVNTTAVQDAIASTYALRSGEHPEDPVYGTTYVNASVVPALVAVGAAAGAVYLANKIKPGTVPLPGFLRLLA